jgi:hypothetical protein
MEIISQLQTEVNRKRKELEGLEWSLREARDKAIKDRDREIWQGFELSADHVELLKAAEFKYFESGGDYVLIGIEGKRPFGNSDVYRDVARVLGWKLPNDDLSDEQAELAGKLLRELPLALNEIISDY